MYIYLPIAELSVNVFLLLGLGTAIGALSGIFGVGGGFLITPLLIMMGVPPAVAVGTGANQIVASSISGVLAHWRRRTVDVPMGVVLLIGGLAGSALGAVLFGWLKQAGQVDLFVSLAYVFFLGSVGLLMAVEAANALFKRRKGPAKRGKLHTHTLLHGLPFKMKFRKSRLYISALLPLLVGFLVGILSATMGVGGGFIMIPAMIYLLGMPTQVVVGTSLFQIIFVTANATFLQAWLNNSVDVVLALLLTVGGVIGAQFGAKLGARLRGEQLRGLLALLVLAVALELGIELVLTPSDVFSIAAAIPK